MQANLDTIDLINDRVLVVVHLKRIRQAMLRLRIASALIRLAAWILPGAVRVEVSD